MGMFFYVISIRKWRKSGKALLVTAIAAVLVLISSSATERSVLPVWSASPSAIYQVDTKEKVLALTFDISWGELRPEPILKILKDEGVDATFFLSSPWSREHPEIVQQIVDGGFEIASHGHAHKNYSTLADDEIRKQISTAHTILKGLTGVNTSLIRMPNGDFDKRVLRIADELGYSVIQWDTDSLDWKNPGVDAIVNRVVSKAHPGDIVLLHASDSSQQTHLALPSVIQQLRDQGYSFVTVSELLLQTHIDHRLIEDTATAMTRWLK